MVAKMNVLLKALKHSGLFRRNRVALRAKARACLLYLAGLSYRDVAYVCGAVDTSHVSVWRCVKKLEGLKLDMKPRRRRTVALDETKLKDAGWHFYEWVAVDDRTRELLALRAS